jgi:O-antigen/teichoic acid export membrane protein
MKRTIANLFLGVGKPRIVFQARVIQLVIMVIGLFALGLPLGIAGVALAVDAMLVIGIAFVLWRAKQYVDFSIKSLLMIPTIALVLGLIVANLAIGLAAPSSVWVSGAIKAVCFGVIYAAILAVFEREELTRTYRLLMKYR